MDEVNYLRDRVKYLEALKKKQEIEESLPHKYKYGEYYWAKKYRESTNRIKGICAANQISKSSTQIRHFIDLATDPTQWPKYFGDKAPSQFWYLYPTREICTVEYEQKWSEFMPRGRAIEKNSQYFFKEDWDGRRFMGLSFPNVGVSIYFKTYMTDVSALQSGSVNFIGADEEVPMELFDELTFRVAATDGMLSFVFTPTLGQVFWREVIEEGTRLKEGFFQQVSMYDCLRYTDGTKSHWTEEKIARLKDRCKSEAEVQRRIYGRFVVDSGLKYPGFSRRKNYVDAHPVPSNWLTYVGIDYGSGGDHGHPSAISFVCVDPDYKRGRVIKTWRGDGIQTTAEDTINQYLRMAVGVPNIIGVFYDFAAADLGTIAERMGLPFIRANKSHAVGESTLNSLFKSEMLKIYKSDEQAEKLVIELEYLLETTSKTKALDNSCDSLRYACASVPWDWTAMIVGETKKEEHRVLPLLSPEWHDRERARQTAQGTTGRDFHSVDDELSFWNDYMRDMA